MLAVAGVVGVVGVVAVNVAVTPPSVNVTVIGVPAETGAADVTLTATPTGPADGFSVNVPLLMAPDVDRGAGPECEAAA